MTHIVNGTLQVPAFNATANPGEYTIEGAIYNSASDVAGNGTVDVTVGLVIYVPASDINTFSELPGVMHRYKLTAVTIIDQQTVNATVLWDEGGVEQDTPTNGAFCIITEVTPNRKLGYQLPADFYPSLAAGSTTGAANSDLGNITDPEPVGGGGSSYLHTQPSLSNFWTVQHNKNSINFICSIFDDQGMVTIPNNIVVINPNYLIINFLSDMTGRAVFSFVS